MKSQTQVASWLSSPKVFTLERSVVVEQLIKPSGCPLMGHDRRPLFVSRLFLFKLLVLQ